MLRPVLACLVLFAVPRLAAAQPLPTAVVLTIPPTDASLAPFAAAVDRVERGRLDALAAVHVSSAPALSLADLQLAIGCVGETDACLRAVAGQLQVELLFYATVDRAGETRIVTVHVFDARPGGVGKQAQREGPEADVVEEIEPMLRELLGLPAARAVAAHVDASTHTPSPPSPAPHSPTMLILSLSSFGAMLVAGAVGAIFGALELGSADDYSHTVVTNMMSADAANAALGRAQDQATVANVMFVISGVAAAAGIAFLVLELTSGQAHSEPHAAVSLVPAGPGLALQGRF